MKGPPMPHHTLPLELILAGSMWLTAILIFVIMLIATIASLRSTEKIKAKSRPGIELKFNSAVARIHSRRKTENQP
jgi:hypothetical protein